MRTNWQNRLLAIPPSNLVNERIFEMMKIFNQTYPCTITQIFQYSLFNGSINGILSYENQTVKSISHIHESMQINEYIHQYLSENKVVFLDHQKFQLSIGNQIPFSEPINNLLLIPLSINGVVIAFMIGVNIQFQINDFVLSDIQSFTESFIQVLLLTKKLTNGKFTKKEIIVMQYISNGYTTKEISSVLELSESTIKYFIKNIMLKTNSANRAEAVAAMFRMKLVD